MNKVIMSIILLVMFAGTASAGPVEDRINKINTWFANEKAETVEFQKVKWQEGKDQIANTILKIKKLFNWSGN